MKVAGVAVLLVAGALAGCIASGDGITAKEAASKAEPRATQWQADAVLLHLGAWETSNASNSVRRDIGFAPPPDAKVGDGRALVWLLDYGSAAANRTLRVIVFTNGTIFADESEGQGNQFNGAGHVAVRNWEVDSTGLATAVRKHAEVANILAEPDAEMAEFLMGPDNNVSDPVWGFFVASAGLKRVANGGVGARTGDLLAVQVHNLTEGELGTGQTPPMPREYPFSGSVDAINPTAKHAFEVVPGQHSVQVEFSYSSGLPGVDYATFRVLDAQGKELPGGTPGGSATPNGATYFVGEAGTYTFEVTYHSQVPGPLGVPGDTVSYQATVRVS